MTIANFECKADFTISFLPKLLTTSNPCARACASTNPYISARNQSFLLQPNGECWGNMKNAQASCANIEESNTRQYFEIVNLLTCIQYHRLFAFSFCLKRKVRQLHANQDGVVVVLNIPTVACPYSMIDSGWQHRQEQLLDEILAF